MDESIGGVDGGAFLHAMREFFSFNTQVGSSTWSLNQTCIYIIIVTVAFIAAAKIIYPRFVEIIFRVK